MDRHLELIRLNQERILAGTGSPKILVGGINLNCLPNFHTFPLIEMGASIVGITLEREHLLRPDMLYAPHNRPLREAMAMLPSKWKPDFFWDPQVEHGHYLPPGLSEIDIPTVVSFVHSHLGHVLHHMRGMFDCVIAPCAAMAHYGDAVLPWGSSWGSMGERVEMVAGPAKPGPRPIDLACTFGAGSLGAASVRPKVLAEVQALKARRPDLRIEIKTGLPPKAYYELLRQSKVAINVGTFNQQMTYRALEIIDCGAALIHADETGYGSSSKLAEFIQGEVVHSEPGRLESDLDHALIHRSHYAACAFARVEWDYSYRRQYERLFEVAGKAKRKPRLSAQDWSRRAYAVNSLTGFSAEASVHAWALTAADKRTISELPSVGLPDVCLWQPKDEEQLAVFRTDLARLDEPAETIYRKHYGS